MRTVLGRSQLLFSLPAVCTEPKVSFEVDSAPISISKTSDKFSKVSQMFLCVFKSVILLEKQQL